MLDMLKRHAIQVLRQAGHSLPEVAKLAGVSVRSVQRVEDEGAVSSIDNEAERMRRKIEAIVAENVQGLLEAWNAFFAG